MLPKKVLLTKRLLAAASLVERGKNACDVGTDHGFLPVYLVQNGISPFCVACDVNEAPLATAKKAVVRAGAYKQVELILSDGLRKVPKEKAEEIIICGMGGELIAKILSECSYAKEIGRHFVLQPMSKTAALRQYLCKEGYVIEREIPVIEKGHFYTVMSVRYDGIEKAASPLFLAVGKISEESGSDRDCYLHEQAKRIEHIRVGKYGTEQTEEARALCDLCGEIEALCKGEKEV